MNIGEELRREHSKAQAERIAAYVGSDPNRFAELLTYLDSGESRLSQRSAWPISVCVERCPKLAGPHLPKFIDCIERKDLHVGVRRNIVRLLQFVEVPKRYRGEVFELCYRLFADVSQSVAVRADAMTVAAGLADGDPALLGELRLIASAHPEKTTVGIRSRSRRILGV